MRRTVSAGALSLAVLTAACGGSASATTPGSIKVTLTEFKYSTSTIELKAGDKATLDLKNAGAVEHDFVVDAASLKVSIQPGKSATRTIGPLAAGSYEIYCSVPGHKESGMKAQLIVR